MLGDPGVFHHFAFAANTPNTRVVMSVGARRPSPGLILTATVSAAVLVMANVSALNVALPELSRELGANQTEIHWMVDIYAVALAALLLPAGAIGDRFGRRMILLVGLFIVFLASAAVLAMDTPTPVIVARGVSGIGAALVFPATLSTITATLPDDKRSRGVAIWTAAVLVGGIIGILGSGLLVENYWWGSAFLGIAIATIVVLGVCVLWVPDSSDPDEAHLDPLGALLSMVAVGALVLGIVEGPAEGWTSTLSLYPLIIGAVALVAFAAWEWRVPKPLLDVRLFASPGVRAGSLAIFVQFLAAFGFFFVAVFYLAFVLEYGPLDTGLGLLPAGFGVLPAAVIAIPLARRFGRAPVGLVGLCVTAGGFLLGFSVSADTGYWRAGSVMILFGVGLGLTSPPATEAIVEALPKAKQGVASALNDVLRESGAALGIAVVGAAFNAGYRSGIGDIDALPPEAVEAVRETPAAAAVLAPDLGDAGPLLIDGVRTSVIDGWDRAMWVLAGIVLVGAVGYFRWARQAAALEHRAGPLAGMRPLVTTAAAAAVPGPSAVSENVLELVSGSADADLAEVDVQAELGGEPGVRVADDGLAVAQDGIEVVQPEVRVDAEPAVPAVVGPALRVAVISGPDAGPDVAALRSCIDRLNREPDSLALEVVPSGGQVAPDVVVGVHAGSTTGLDVLSTIALASANGAGPSLLSFMRVGGSELPAASQALDAALMWDARQQLTGAGVSVVELDQPDSSTRMYETLVQSIPEWTARAGLGPSATGPAGASESRPPTTESYRQAEEAVNQLVPDLVSVSKKARHLIAHSEVPADLDTWPEEQQVRVFERAAAALREPVTQLADDAAALIERAGECGRLVEQALSEHPGAAGELEHRIDRVVRASERLAGSVDDLAARFSVLSERRPEVAPISRTLDGVAARCQFVVELVSGWT